MRRNLDEGREAIIDHGGDGRCEAHRFPHISTEVVDVEPLVSEGAALDGRIHRQACQTAIDLAERRDQLIGKRLHLRTVESVVDGQPALRHARRFQ